MIFKKEQYLNEQPRVGNMRNYVRGFTDVLADLITQSLGDKENTRLVEFGVGGGGTHQDWCRYTTNTEIYGVELPKNHKDYAFSNNAWDKGFSCFQNERMNFIENDTRNFNSCAEALMNHTGNKKFNVIIEDSFTNMQTVGVDLQEFTKVYSTILDEDGIMLTGGLQGYYSKQFPGQDFIEGWVVLDLISPTPETLIKYQNPHTYLWVYANNYSLYKNILNKYTIVSGKELL